MLATLHTTITLLSEHFLRRLSIKELEEVLPAMFPNYSLMLDS